MTPLMVGLKLTAMVHFAPAASEPPHGVAPLPAAAKLPLAAILEMLRLNAVLLVTVTVLLVLFVPTSWLVKVKLVGENVSGEEDPPEPLPDSATSCGLKLEL